MLTVTTPPACAGITFAAASNFTVGAGPRSVAVGDFNGDGVQDLAVANFSSDNVSVLTGTGTGSFGAALNFTVGTSPRLVAVGDFNGDGVQDLATANQGSGNVSVLTGTGTGSFGAASNFNVGTQPQSVAVGDFNGDGVQDLAVANLGSNNVSVLTGTGTGSFGAASNFTVGTNPYSVAVGDFNGDGIQDLAAANASSNNLSVLLRTCPATATPTSSATNTFTPTPSATNTFTPTPTTTNTSTATATNTPTPVGSPVLNGTVTYGNADAAPTPRFVSNVTITAEGSPNVFTTTDFAGGNYTLTGFGAGAYTVTPTKTGGVNGAISSFDAGRIALHVAGPPNPQLTATQLIVADVSGNGSVTSFDAGMIAKFVAGPPYTAPGIGSAGTWRFTPISRNYASITGNVSGQDYVALLMGEVSGNWANTGARPAGKVESGKWKVDSEGGGPERGIAVELPELVTAIDKEIVIPVSVQGVVDKGIISYEFDLRYDPSVISPVQDPVDLAGTVSRGLTAMVNAAEPGLLRVAVYGPIAIDRNGVLLNLRFAAVGAAGASSPLILEKIMFNEGNPRVNATDGSIIISSLAEKTRAFRRGD